MGTAREEAGECSSQSGVMVLKQKTARKQGAPSRCCHATIPTVSASSLMDLRLVANAGLLLPATIAQHLGLRELVDHHLNLGGAPERANMRDKMLTLVAAATLSSPYTFARSPQAKGRVERMAGTFQDRLVSELGLAGARTIQQANAVLRDFLPRFNAQFHVPAQQAQLAYRSLDSSLSLKRILCFKHLRQVARDNTVKYQWCTLQLLPSQERPSFAGVKVEVLEQSDGQLMVQ